MLKFIILNLFCNLIFGFKHSDICIQTETNCKTISVTKNIRLNCVKAECSGGFKHQCGPTHCAVDIISCDIFRDLNSFLLRSFIMPVMSLRQIRKYLTTLDKIVNCPIVKWNKTDICVKNSNCFQENEHKKIGIFKTINTSVCKCGKKHRFHCFQQFCVTNGKTCNAFGSLLVKNVTDISELGKCDF